MNPFLKNEIERRQIWKSLRESLRELPENEQLEKVVNFWSQAPLGRSPIDVTDCKTWETPWTMIAHNNWCQDSVAIGMEFTLRLSGWNPERMSLRYINDYQHSQMIMVLRVDNLALNFEYNRVLEWPTTPHRILQEWVYDGRRYSEVDGSHKHVEASQAFSKQANG